MKDAIRSIAFVNDKAGAYGGTEEYIASFGHRLRGFGVDCHLLYGALHGCSAPSMTSSSRFQKLAERGPAMGADVQVREAIDQIGPDVAYVHNVLHPEVVYRLAREPRDYAVIWYVHDHFATCLTELRAQRGDVAVCAKKISEDCITEIRLGRCVKKWKEASYGPEDLAQRRLMLDAMCRVDAVVVISEYMRSVVLAHREELRNRIHVLPRQIRCSSTRLERASRDGNELALAFVGRIAIEKGLDVLIEAVAEIRVGRRVLLRIAGPVESEDYWRECKSAADAVALKNPSLRISYEGHVSYEEVDAILERTDIVAMPSRGGEATGNVAAEALVCGAAVVASNVGGVSTFVRHGVSGLLVPANDPLRLRVAIEELAARPDLREFLTRNGRDYILQNHTMEAHLGKFMKVAARVWPRSGRLPIATRPEP